MDKARNLMRLPISEQTMLNILRGRVTVQGFDIPDDSRVVGVHFDFMINGWQIVLESAAFGPVPPGEQIPVLRPVVTSLLTPAEPGEFDPSRPPKASKRPKGFT